MPDLALVLDRDPRSIAPARAALRSFADPWLSPDDVDNATLVASELVTNAQRYAPDDGALLHVTLLDHVLRIEVIDTAATRPALPAEAGADAETGRGLFIVEALARRWGSSPHRLGKCVWAELAVRLLADPALA